MKNPYEAKSRLSSVFSRDQRAELALNVMRRVIVALQASLVSKIAVVGGGPLTESYAKEGGVGWMDASGNDLNEDLHGAMCLSAKNDFVPIYFPGDLPFLNYQDINEVIGASNCGSNAVLVPSGSDGGTNCFLNPFFSCFKPLLGRDSFRKHIEFAESQNVPFVVRRVSGLLLDLDTEDDLHRCDTIESGFIKRLGSST